VLATRYIEDIRAEKHERFDLVGMILAGFGIAGVSFGMSLTGLDFVPTGVVIGTIIGGVICLGLYVIHARRTPAPVLDLSLLSIPTFRASVVGGFLFRLGIGASPFLLPLMMQLGLKMNPFQSGMITFAGALGSMFMKPVIGRVLKLYGFRNVLIYNALLSAVSLALCATFDAGMSVMLIYAIVLMGGFFRSLEFTAVNTLAYADVEMQRVGKATPLVSVMQQISISSGVAVGAMAVEVTQRVYGHSEFTTADFQPAFLFAAALAAAAGVFFWLLPADAGAELANRTPAPVPTQPSDDRVG
jgi:MFS family permease